MDHRPSRPRNDSLTEFNLDSMLPSSLGPADGTTQFQHSSASSNSLQQPLPERIGRYEIEALLGEGGYGRVFKALDSQLQRHVAVKVPHVYRMTKGESLDRYLEEARTLALLDHPGIVSVHDVGVTDDGLPYIVSNFIDGMSLSERIRKSQISLADAIELLVVVGRALAYVHSRGVIHRDVKPGNILLSVDDTPYLADFGLALREEFDEADRLRVGTPAYMSPEQARGESHLVDGRSDIFSLGVVLYEMMTGRLPFSGDNRKTVIRNLLEKEATPPRQLNAMVPRELERICLKALAKRSSDRYTTASDMVDDLEHFLGQLGDSGNTLATKASTIQSSDEVSRKATVVPRGLRSFDRHDASFFRRLLPGPYDREWTPESLLFWKRKLELTDPDDPLRVGVIYGPSGCGKSSFVKAGLIPILDDSISTVFVEATHADTEARLLRGIRKRVSGLAPNQGLAQSLAEIRRGSQRTRGHRLVIVIDQFEQWLHGRSEQEDSDLALALRQCDGIHLQCVLLLRDDFWLAMSRFASVLEVPLKQNHNVTMVDLFSLPHARRVLADFGVAYDRLPASLDEQTPQQNLFLDTAVEELSEDGKVIPVRLSLFVEMIKSQPWELSTLVRLGGVQGIGLQFLEEAFSGTHAPASQRIHLEAVRNVLRQLLPEQGGTLKGTMKSESELLTVSGYEEQPAAFDAMINILDTELRLITPTDPIGSKASGDSLSESSEGVRYYQLTHDFLVPALYEWLYKHQRETRRGRAQLRLAEYTTLWSSKPNPKFAPSWSEWIHIRLLTSPGTWSAAERRMMRAAGRRHVRHTMVALAIFVGITVGLTALQQWARITAATRQLRTAQTSQLIPILDLLREDKLFAPRSLRQAITASEPGSRDELVSRLAMFSHDSSQGDVLVEHLLTEPLPMVVVLANELRPWRERIMPKMAACLNDPSRTDSQRLRAAIVLSHFSVDAGRPNTTTLGAEDGSLSLLRRNADFVVDAALQHALLTPQDFNLLMEEFAPASAAIIPSLARTCLQRTQSPQRMTAMGMLIHYLRDDRPMLLRYALESAEDQIDAFIAELGDLRELTTELMEYASEELDPTMDEEAFDLLSSRKANALAILHRIGISDPAWMALQASPMPHTRTYLIHRVPTLGDHFDTVLNKLIGEADASVRQAIVLTLGQFDLDQVTVPLAVQAIREMKYLFENDPDVSVHSAARWVLRRHGENEWIRSTLKLQGSLPRDPRKNWYVNSEGHTMAIFDARDVPEIGRIFELATAEVTKEQFLRHKPDYNYYVPHRFPDPDCPSGSMHWYEAVEYCRWLNNELLDSVDDSYPPGLEAMAVAPDLDNVLQQGAYRLPTSAEWYFACAAGTQSRRYFGINDSLINEYFWHYATSVIDETEMMVRYWGADLKKPNDFGMFGMYDGVSEWCHDYAVRDERRFVMGFNSAQSPNLCVTSEVFGRDLPRSSNGYYGLRIARTGSQDERP